jgi:hypothetical protein
MIGRFSFDGFVASIIVSSWLLFGKKKKKKVTRSKTLNYKQVPHLMKKKIN